VIESAGQPYLLINSAGVTHPGLFQDLEPEIFHRLMAINYFGAVNTTRAVLPGMLARGSGHIINISSLSGQIATIGYTAYAASKFALRGFTDALRSELKPLGIRLSIVFPPDTDTPQLAYENEFKPPVVKALGSFAGLVSPEYVAKVTLGEAAQGRYIIVPGLESKLWYRVYGLAGDLSYPILDWFIRRARRKVAKSKENV
jgi:3-dehydrosphinganine reductase